MKVRIETLALPMLAEAFGSKRFDFEFEGNTAADLIDALGRSFGKKCEQALYERAKGKDKEKKVRRLDPSVQILVNGRTWVNQDSLATPLTEGSIVVFMLLAGGG
ncbi:MAG: MoaD/ThiS family protein [Planctomycetota bacterium]|nr:MoaD/ThiS family protein [Planctomycetota bacterium]